MLVEDEGEVAEVFAVGMCALTVFTRSGTLCPMASRAARGAVLYSNACNQPGERVFQASTTAHPTHTTAPPIAVRTFSTPSG